MDIVGKTPGVVIVVFYQTKLQQHVEYHTSRSCRRIFSNSNEPHIE
jgi:hypothetical protein